MKSFQRENLERWAEQTFPKSPEEYDEIRITVENRAFSVEDYFFIKIEVVKNETVVKRGTMLASKIYQPEVAESDLHKFKFDK
ncbi:MAG: hypothetical protein V1819_03470 [bacterium]